MTLELDRLAVALEQAIGADRAVLGERALEAAVRALIAGGRAADIGALALQVATDRAALDALIETVVVPETWFYRDAAMFELVVQRARAHLGPRFAILSAPCATGEEAYSCAMALLAAGVPAGHFAIDGLDVSARAIASARRGRYGGLAFREGVPGLRERWFQPDGDAWLVRPAVRPALDFQVANLLERSWPVRAAPYDLIFCRHLLIYLTPSARAHVLDRVAGLLAPGGLVISSASELLDAVDPRFVRQSAHGTCVYALAPARITRARAGSPTRPPRTIAPPPPGSPPAPPPPPLAAPPAPLAPPVVDGPPVTLAGARALANANRLDEALAICARVIRDAPTDVAAHALAGVIHVARKDDHAAEQALRRAVYLDPGHYEALSCLALLHERRDDRAQAANFRRRAARAGKPGTTR